MKVLWALGKQTLKQYPTMLGYREYADSSSYDDLDKTEKLEALIEFTRSSGISKRPTDSRSYENREL